MAKYYSLTFNIRTTLVALILLLTVPYLVQMLGIIFLPKTVSVWRQLSLYQWLAAGMVTYAVVYRLLKRMNGSLYRNLQWFETLLLGEVHTFHAEKSSGVITTSGRTKWLSPLVSLAPYCLPIYTYALLMLRPLLDFHGLIIYDILIGLTLAFHVVNFKKDTSRHQPAINQYPLLFSYLYIATALCINLAVVWVAFFPGYNVFTSFWRLLCAQASNIAAMFGWIF